jgi:hypothetical protein
MRLEDLIKRLREQINSQIAARNAQTEALNALRAQDGFDAAQETGIIAARGEIDAELAVLRSRLEDYEAELREDEAIERMQAQVTPVATRADGETTCEVATVRVGDEPRTYRQDADPKGVNFLSDVAAQALNNGGAAMRLDRHMQEERTLRGPLLDRAVGTAAFAGLVVPQYLVDLYAPQAKAGRPFADACRKHDLPETGMTASIGRVTTGTSVGVQASEGTAASETDIDDTLLTVNIQTAAGQQTLSRQAVERGIGV